MWSSLFFNKISLVPVSLLKQKKKNGKNDCDIKYAAWKESKRIAATTSSRCLRPKKRNNYVALLAIGSRKAPSWSIESRENEKEKRKNMKKSTQQFVICDLNFTVCFACIFSASLAFFARLLRGARRVIMWVCMRIKLLPFQHQSQKSFFSERANFKLVSFQWRQ